MSEPLDVAKVKAEHQPNIADSEPDDAWCRYCAEAWPCDPYRLAAELAEARRQLAAAKPQERPPEATDAPQSAEQPPKAPADTPDAADDHTALGEYPPLTHCLFTGGDHLLNDLGVCVRCDTAPPPPPLDIRDAPASYTTEPPAPGSHA